MDDRIRTVAAELARLGFEPGAAPLAAQAGLTGATNEMAARVYLECYPRYQSADYDADIVAEDVASWWGCPESLCRALGR